MSVVAYRAARVLTGRVGEALDAAEVVVDGDMVAAVGPVGTAPPGVLIVDLDDATVLPGLVDAHVHLCFDGSADPVGRLLELDDDGVDALLRESARRLLIAGVTTARDLGGPGFRTVVLRRAIDEGTVVGPRLLVSGPPITTTAGHCWFFGGGCADPEAMVAAVRTAAAAGVDVVKVMVSGGAMTEGSSPAGLQVDAQALAVIVAEASAHGLPVAAHAHSPEAIAAAVSAGVATIEHCTFLGPEGFALDTDLLDRVAAAPVAVCPTLNHLAPALLARVGADRLCPAVPELRRRGASIVAGTDAGVPHVPHHAYARALVALVELGWTAAEAIAAATVEAAAAIGLGGRVGLLAPGYEADLLAVKGDPRADLGALERLRLVVARGRPVRPGPLPPIEAPEVELRWVDDEA